MTEDEKRRQKADLLLEIEETRELIAHLNEAALAQKERIYDVSQWLEQSRSFEHSSYVSHFKSLDEKISKSIESYRKAMNFDSAEEIVRQLKDAAKKLSALKERKEALGMK